MYKIINWNTDEVMGEYVSLAQAKRVCKTLGHTGEINAIYTSFPPVAYVADDNGLVYNPRFAFPNSDTESIS